MVITHIVDDFLFELFSEAEHDTKKLTSILKRYYTLGPFEPEVELKDSTIEVSIDVVPIRVSSTSWSSMRNPEGWTKPLNWLMSLLKNDAGEWYVQDPDKEENLERLRNPRLLKQFEEYKEQAFKAKGKIKECLVEALRAGFKQS